MSLPIRISFLSLAILAGLLMAWGMVGAAAGFAWQRAGCTGFA